MDDYLGRDSRIFREKYDVEKLIMKSANGILYQGEIKWFFINCKLFVSAKSKVDGKTVCIKQVRKSNTSSWATYNGRRVPREFYMHFMASKVKGVVKVSKKVVLKISN